MLTRLIVNIGRKLGERSMSVRPSIVAGSDIMRPKVTLKRIQKMKESQIPITMLTAYDYPTARLCESHDVDVVLVGDSLAQVCLGYDSTTRLTLPEMLHHVKAVARGSKTALLAADMPFGSYHGSLNNTMDNAIKMVQEGGAESLKLEGGEEIASIVSSLTRIGIPVMAHIGLLPQRHTSTSGYKVQGRSAQSAQALLRAAYVLQDAGAHAIILEAIPSPLGAYITSKLDIPTIGIGAGPNTDGQVLVMPDALGTWEGHKAKFVRRFGDLKAASDEGVEGYIEAVRARSFPSEGESYSIPDEEWHQFLDMEKLGLQEVTLHPANSTTRHFVTS